MKILLDENIPKIIKPDFGEQHDVRTVREMNWLGKKNGELLGLAVLNGFDALVTLDKNLRHQQNLSRFPITIFLLIAFNNRRETLLVLVKKLIEKITEGKLQPFIEIS